MRYEVYDQSHLPHTGGATVVDTTQPLAIGRHLLMDELGRQEYVPVCECSQERDARRICLLLNNAEARKQRRRAKAQAGE